MKTRNWDFPGGPVVKTLHFHCRGQGSIPGWGTKIPHDTVAWPKQKQKTHRNSPNWLIAKLHLTIKTRQVSFFLIYYNFQKCVTALGYKYSEFIYNQ